MPTKNLLQLILGLLFIALIIGIASSMPTKKTVRRLEKSAPYLP